MKVKKNMIPTTVPHQSEQAGLSGSSVQVANLGGDINNG